MAPAHGPYEEQRPFHGQMVRESDYQSKYNHQGSIRSQSYPHSSEDSSTHRASLILLMLVALPIGICAIAFIELTIPHNHIDMSAGPITAAGQLIPLIIGAYSLLSATWYFVKRWKREEDDDDRSQDGTDGDAQSQQDLEMGSIAALEAWEGVKDGKAPVVRLQPLQGRSAISLEGVNILHEGPASQEFAVERPTIF